MPISLDQLTRLSPFLYHVTYETSVNRIRRLRQLHSAATLMQAGDQLQWLRRRRDEMVTFRMNGDIITLTDQLPIKERNIAFQGRWTLPDLIEAINRRVFFWRGPVIADFSRTIKGISRNTRTRSIVSRSFVCRSMRQMA